MHGGRGPNEGAEEAPYVRICLPFILPPPSGKTPLTVDFILHPMTLTSDTDSCTAAEPVQVLTPPPSPPLAEDDATTTATAPPTSVPAKKKKKKKSKKSSKAKDPATSPPPPPTPTPTAEENQPPPLYISRNKHWKYISSFHVRVPLGSEIWVLKFEMLSRDHGYNFLSNSSSPYSF